MVGSVPDIVVEENKEEEDQIICNIPLLPDEEVKDNSNPTPFIHSEKAYDANMPTGFIKSEKIKEVEGKNIDLRL